MVLLPGGGAAAVAALWTVVVSLLTANSRGRKGGGSSSSWWYNDDPADHGKNRAAVLAPRASRSSNNVVLIVDVENVRGTTGFALSHDVLFQSLFLRNQQQQQHASLTQRIMLVVDHGNVGMVHYQISNDTMISFSGNGIKADDVIARTLLPHLTQVHGGGRCRRPCAAAPSSSSFSIPLQPSSMVDEDGDSSNDDSIIRTIAVVTQDGGLIQRCRKFRGVHIISPQSLLDDLAYDIVRLQRQEEQEERQGADEEEDDVEGTEVSSSGLVLSARELEVGADILEIDAQLHGGGSSGRRKRGSRRKGGGILGKRQRQLLRTRCHELWQELQRQRHHPDSPVERIIQDVIKLGPHCASVREMLSSDERKMLLTKWENALSSSRRRRKSETTEDRIVLAEALRLRLLDAYPTLEERYDLDDATWWPDFLNGRRDPDGSFSGGTSAEMVVAATTTTSTMAANDDVADDLLEALSSPPQQQPDNPTATKVATPTSVDSSIVDDSASMTTTNGGSNNDASLTVVVVSDTYGLQDQLPSPLPDGDVLLHLGGFLASRGGGGGKDNDKEGQLRTFDAWLGRQPHATKIVLRGQADPKPKTTTKKKSSSSRPFLSNATRYITVPTTVRFGGLEGGNFTFAFVPVGSNGGRRGQPQPLLPHRPYDVLVSHEPPYQILDRRRGRGGGGGTTDNGGSKALLKAATKFRPHALWICGHVPESRGVVRCGPGVGAVIVNAANGVKDQRGGGGGGADTLLAHGPTVIRLHGPSRPRHDRVEILQMSGWYKYMNQDHAAFFDATTTTLTDAVGLSPLLLAVDLGLRTGISLFGHNGTILKYEQFQFDNVSALREGARKILCEWPNDKCTATSSGVNTSSPTMITHVAIEGKDPPLADAWRSAIFSLVDDAATPTAPPRLLFVNPEEWRVDLLSEPERRNGASAKASSQYWARRALSAQEQSHHEAANDDMDAASSSLPEDVAESILLGMHISRRLGWVVDQRPSLYCQSV